MFQRNTFISRGTAAGLTGALSYDLTGATYRDNVFVGCGSKPLNRDSGGTPASITNNFADTAITGVSTGFTVAANLIQGTNDLRPATGGPLIGAATANAQNTSDIRGKFRGMVPDVGASMLNSAALPNVANAVITRIDVLGQKVTVTGTYNSTFTSATASMAAAATPNGAVSTTTSVNASGGNFTAEFRSVHPGNYAVPVITFTNQSGAGGCSGGNPVVVGVPAAPTVTITNQSKNGRTVTVVGTLTGYPASGTMSLPAASTPNGAVTVSSPIAINDNSQTFTVTFSNVAYGNYAAPVVDVTNYSGTASAAGKAFSLYAPGSQPSGTPVVDLPPYVVPAFGVPNVGLNAAATDVTIDNISGTNQTNVPFTFGQAFKKSDLSPEDYLLGKITGNADVPLQFDVKATYDDGSVRHAIISGVLPALNASSSKKMSLVRVNDTSVTDVGVSTASIVAAGFSASASLDIAGTVYTADATAALSAGTNIFSTWLQGSIATEYVLNIPFKGVDGQPHAFLMAQFAIRFYPGINKAKVDVAVESTKAYTVTSDVTYNVILNVGGVQKYSKNGLVHFPLARWKKTYDWNAANVTHIRHNTAYLIATKQVANYNQSIVMDEATLSGYASMLATSSEFEPMGKGRFTSAMGTTGGRPDIGLAPDSYAATIISMDKRAKDMMLASANCGGSWDGHRRDDSTGPGAGMPLDIIHFPYSTLLGTQSDSFNSATGKYERFPAYTSTTPFTSDSSHQPAFAYVPYLLTGDFYYMEELHFWCNYNLFQHNPAYRNYEQGVWTSDQLRGQGWTMRTMAEAAAITPDNHPQKMAFRFWLDNNLRFYNTKYTDGNHNALGVVVDGSTVVYSMNGGTNNGLAPWQDDHFTSAVGHASELGFTEATRLLLWKAKFQIGRMIAPGFCWLVGSIYNLAVKDSESSPYYTTLADCYVKSVSAELASKPCASQAFTDQLNVERTLPSNPYVLNEMTGYSYDNQGFPSNLQPALALAADSGYTDGDLAWNLFDSRAVKPNYTISPQFAIVPRTVSSTGGGTPATVPSKPLNVLATAGNGKATISFSAPASNGGAAISGYVVTASTGQNASGLTSPVDIVVPNGVAVTFTVHANNSVGPSPESDASNSVTPSAGGPSVPGKPTNVVATVNSNGTVNVAFNPPSSDGGAAISGYQVNSSTSQVFTGVSSPMIVTVPPDTPVAFTVQAINAAGPSPLSDPSNTVTVVSQPVVTSVTVIPSSATVAGGNVLNLTAVVAGDHSPSTAVTWSAPSGTVNDSGIFVAPPAGLIETRVVVTATSVQDPTKFGTCVVTVPATDIPNPVGTALRHYSGNITNRFGVAIEGAKVTVVNTETGLAATLFKDKDRTPKYNPILTDDEGFFEFYVEAQQCSYSVKGFGIEPYTRENIFDIISNVDLSSVQRAIVELQSGKVSQQDLDAAVDDLVQLTDFSTLSAEVDTLQQQVGALPVPVTVDVHKFVTGGLGTVANPWTGWDTIIQWAANTQYDFHDGVYAYPVSPNFAKNFLKLRGRKNTVLKHTGNGFAVVVDAGAAAQVVVGVEMENITVESNANATGGVYQRGCCHSKFDVNFRNTPGVCFTDISGVVNKVTLRHSSVGFADTVKPVTLLATDKRANTVECSGNVYSLIAEDCSGIGVSVANTINCQFIGTSQLNGSGLYVAATGKYNRFVGLDATHNTNYDIKCDGDFNKFENVRSDSVATFGGNYNAVAGGVYDAINNTGKANSFGQLVYSINTGLFNNGGSNISKIMVYNATTNTLDVDETQPAKNLVVTGKTRLSSDTLLVGNGQITKLRDGRTIIGGTASNGLTRLQVVNSENTALDQNIGSYMTDAAYATTAFHYVGKSGGSVVFQVTGQGNVQNERNVYGAISDAKLKENVVDTGSKLADLLNVRVVNYNLISDPAKEKLIGVIAQELEQVFPGMVDTAADGTKSVKYSVFVPMLIKAIQELSNEIDALKGS
jgi:hypothetical protein